MRPLFLALTALSSAVAEDTYFPPPDAKVAGGPARIRRSTRPSSTKLSPTPSKPASMADC